MTNWFLISNQSKDNTLSLMLHGIGYCGLDERLQDLVFLVFFSGVFKTEYILIGTLYKRFRPKDSLGETSSE